MKCNHSWRSAVIQFGNNKHCYLQFSFPIKRNDIKPNLCDVLLLWLQFKYCFVSGYTAVSYVISPWYSLVTPITVAARSKTWTVFARSNTGIVGSNPTWDINICVYSVFVLSYVQVAALRWDDPPSKESYRLCKRSRNWKSGQGRTKGFRAIDSLVTVHPHPHCNKEGRYVWKCQPLPWCNGAEIKYLHKTLVCHNRRQTCRPVHV
jgi:hypothetical protein